MEEKTDSFIVRISHGTPESERAVVTWRGSIEHVGSDQRLYFRDLAAILRFIQQRTGVAHKHSGSRWKAIRAWIRHDTT